MNQETDMEAVIQAEEALAAAHLSLDLATIDRLLHPDYVIIQPGGTIEDKAATLASLHADQRHWEIAQSDQLDVRLYGETAVVVGRWRGKGQNGAEPFDYQARFLSVWVRENDLWRNVAYEAAPIEYL
jgi:ketosteroid isomerase-like protein